jgi:hypothetical protein
LVQPLLAGLWLAKAVLFCCYYFFSSLYPVFWSVCRLAVFGPYKAFIHPKKKIKKKEKKHLGLFCIALLREHLAFNTQSLCPLKIEPQMKNLALNFPKKK